MDFKDIKKFVKQNGNTFIFMEGDNPEVVLMSFEAYESLLKKEREAVVDSVNSPSKEDELEVLGDAETKVEFLPEMNTGLQNKKEAVEQNIEKPSLEKGGSALSEKRSSEAAENPIITPPPSQRYNRQSRADSSSLQDNGSGALLDPSEIKLEDLPL